MDNYELTTEETAQRLNLFREALNSHDVPHGAFDNIQEKC